MSEIYYTKDHEWIKIDGDVATIGITEFAQDQLGDIVFVELPEVGKNLSVGDEAAVVESVKAASEVYAPIDGQVTEINPALADNPALVNSAAQSEGWFVKLKNFDKGQCEALMREEEYQKMVEGE